MGFNKKTVKDVHLAGKRVLLRADYNVSTSGGKVSNGYRIEQSVPTIEYIWKQYESSIVIISHLGRPEGKPDSKLSLRPVAEELTKLLDKKVKFIADIVGDEAKRACEQLKPGEILLLENVRFDPREKQNSKEFAKELVDTAKAEVFVQDGFGVVHRKDASTDAITKFLPSVAGLLLEKEISTITEVMGNPKHPLVAIVGGAKIEDKIEILDKFIDLADCVALGGAMANDFLKAQGHRIGQSLYDKADLDVAHELLTKAKKKANKQPFNFMLPVDVVVAESMEGRSKTRVVDLSTHALSDIEAYPKLPNHASYNLSSDEAIYDIGPMSAAKIAGAITFAKTVIWNGTLGVTEVNGIAGAHAPFAHGSRLVAEAVIGRGKKDPSRPFSLAGGGDTAGYLESEGLVEDFDHVSTGGGATLELMAGHKLPGVEALENR